MQGTRPTASAPSLSVVVPLRDEAATLAELHERLRRALPADAELIFVDDGSRDASPRLIASIVAADAGAVGLRLPRPRGKSEALAAGFSRARGRAIATIDADLQEDPEEIPRLLARLEDPAAGAHAGGLDLVSGWRRRRRDPALKVLASRVFNAVIAWIAGLPLRDVNCGLKVLRREVAEAIPLDGGYHRFIPLLAHWRGFRVGELEVAHQPRRAGRSRFGSERFLHGLIDLAVLVFLERFERRPSRFFLGAGLLLAASGTAICGFIAWLRLSTGSIQSRYPLLALGVLLVVVGLQLGTTGLLAELIALGRRGAPSTVRDAVEIRAGAEPAPPPAGDGSEAARAGIVGGAPRVHGAQ
jgi:glycosyltransferase involved in cell wall biosynthesis